MVETNHHLVRELSPEDKRSLRMHREERRLHNSVLMRTLGQYCDPEARRRGLVSATDLRQLLATQTFSNVPRHMLSLKDMPRHRQGDFTTRATPRHAHLSPKRLAFTGVSTASSHGTQGVTPTEEALSPASAGPLVTSSYARRLRGRSATPTSKWDSRRAFTVSLNRSLPLSYEAQCDVRYVTGARRRSSLHLESGFASLFSRAKSRGTTHSELEELSPREEVALRFLHVDAENPRRLIELQQQEKHRWDREKGPTKSELNTPEKMPDLLGKTLPKDYTPNCVVRRTESTERLFEGQEARMQAARERMAIVGPLWHL